MVGDQAKAPQDAENTEERKAGQCRLCSEKRVLQNSHIWPRFAYNKYVSGKGGSFVNLQKQRVDNKQYQRFWFCNECEGLIARSESDVARCLKRFEDAPDSPVDYPRTMLEFVASITMRSIQLQLEESVDSFSEQARVKLREAVRRIRRYLLGKEQNLSIFTQHVFFVVPEPKMLMHCIASKVNTELNVVFNQIGPMIMIGLLDRKMLSSTERRILQESEITSHGGVLSPVQEWHTGKNIPKSLARIINLIELERDDKVARTEIKNLDRLARKPRTS